MLVDTPPDLREQCLDAGIDRIDALIYTHAHADHVNGIDDLRAINVLMDRAIDTYGDAAVLGRIRERFGYAFQAPEPALGWWRPALNPIVVEGPFRIGDLEFRPFEQVHGRLPSWGFRTGAFAYSPDVKELPEAALAELAGVEVWLVDCLRDRPHPSHAHLEQTLAWIELIKPRRAILTHMNHELDYRELSGACRPGSSRPTTAWCSRSTTLELPAGTIPIPRRPELRDRYCAGLACLAPSTDLGGRCGAAIGRARQE